MPTLRTRPGLTPRAQPRVVTMAVEVGLTEPRASVAHTVPKVETPLPSWPRVYDVRYNADT